MKILLVKYKFIDNKLIVILVYKNIKNLIYLFKLIFFKICLNMDYQSKNKDIVSIGSVYKYLKIKILVIK